MPHYQFAIVHAQGADLDTDGAFLDDDAAAILYAWVVIQELRQDDPDCHKGSSIEIITEGRTVASLPFDEPTTD